ncbi:MAG: ribosomal RNA small subunit methyltransferase A [Proteobacteria bacterium]|nr:ribosomal RNA small subunit methyltransferase A [Pseudomonadota bacterium]MBU1714562.1 ribosomal RNA small subunit methyltransferase A [Pseudomonadota bacterium]
MPNPINIKNILKEKKLAPQKKLGQNFLRDPQTAIRIIELAGVTSEDTIIELGVGLGSLTVLLAQRAKKVIGLEIDRGIVEWHRETNDLPANVTLIHQDLLKTNFNELAEQHGHLKIIANLPYSISSPLLFKLIKDRDALEYAVLMLQKEVGQRLTAEPATKEYGVLSVLLGTCASMQTLMHVSPAMFHPRPKVDSVVVSLRFNPIPKRCALLPEHDYDLLRKVVNAAFQQRRKTLINALSAANLMELDKKGLTLVLEKAGIAPSIRAERLTIEDYVRLTNVLANS